MTKQSLALAEAAAAFPTATLFEANRQQGALPSAIKPAVPGMRLSGRAFTVQGPPGDNLWLHRGIAEASPGDVLVCHVGNHHEAGYWGEIMSTAAQRRGLAGVVIDGCVRDATLLAEIGFPVFARGLCIRGTGKDKEARGALGTPIVIGAVEIHTGDIVVGDGDGVVVIRHDWAARTIAAAREREDKEAEVIRQLHAGRTTVELFGLA
ncbi:MAG TPA: RraA family protein [Azospirillum sp.]|nr:RraA family protein [Azospirillum sp.]